MGKATSKNGKKTGGKFLPGNKYGKGRPAGSRNAATLALEALLDSEGERITRRAIRLALSGDPVALRLCVERLIPARRERPIQVKLPVVKTVSDVSLAIGTVMAAVAKGTITPGEGQALAGLLDSHREALETQELESRLLALEEKLEKHANETS